LNVQRETINDKNNEKLTMTEVTGLDHLYLSVSDLVLSESFYDTVFINFLGFKKSTFQLAGEPHIQYYNRHFGVVLRPARALNPYYPYTPGLHHICLRVNTIDEVTKVAAQLRGAGIEATEAKLYPEYALDNVATYFADPDGIQLEITNYRQERRDRHDQWKP